MSYAQALEVLLGDLNLTATDDDGGVDWMADTLTGWFGSPPSTIQLTQKPRASGAWKSSLYTQPRIITISGYLDALDPDRLEIAINRLNEVAAVKGTPLQVTGGDGIARTAQVYRQDEVLTAYAAAAGANWSVQMVAPDPRKFADTISASTALPSSSGGLVVPFTIPFTVSGVIVSGGCSIVNPGNEIGPVKLRIDGPITGPQITHLGSGLALVFASSVTLAAGEWLDVDMENQTVLANGQSSRAGWITKAGWSGFEPGLNEWSFAAVDGSGLLTVNATPAWQ